LISKYKKSKEDILQKKQFIEIFVVCISLGIGLLVYDYVDTRVYFNGQIERNEAGRGKIDKDLTLSFLNHDEEVSVEVSDMKLSQEKADLKFDEAISEIENTFLGKNPSADAVTEDLDLRTSYCNGIVNAEWKFDYHGLISTDGVLRTDKIPEEGLVVGLIADLSYEDFSTLYCFSVFVTHKSLDTLEGQLEAIKKSVRQIDESTRANKEMVLPEQVSGIDLVWKEKMNFRGLQLILLGIVTVLALKIGKAKDEKNKRDELIREKEADYPMIVSELSILMGAGMSFRKALEKIVSKYSLKKKEGIIRPGYEDLSLTYRKICDGKGDIAAIEELGLISGSKEYRKLAMLLTQNLRKGSGDLLRSLEKEEKYAFEMRKQRAIQEGEKASTKLLLPMGGMLFIVIVVLIVPAVMQMNI